MVCPLMISTMMTMTTMMMTMTMTVMVMIMMTILRGHKRIGAHACIRAL